MNRTESKGASQVAPFAICGPQIILAQAVYCLPHREKRPLRPSCDVGSMVRAASHHGLDPCAKASGRLFLRPGLAAGLRVEFSQPAHDRLPSLEEPL